MSEDLECPYCNWKRTVPDECYEPDTHYEVECENCSRYFGFKISYWPTYDEYQLPCSNGDPHNYQPLRSSVPNRVRCSYCGDITTLDKIEKTDEL